MILASGGASVTGGRLVNSTSYTYWTINSTGIRSVRLVGFTPTFLNYQYILTTTGGKGLIMLPNGSVQDNSTGSDIQVLPPGTLKVGTSYTGTITLTAPRAFVAFGASPGAGNAWLGSIAGLELR
jgi:hypothetical protein